MNVPELIKLLNEHCDSPKEVRVRVYNVAGLAESDCGLVGAAINDVSVDKNYIIIDCDALN